jgi:hypothetical protein
MRRWPGSGWPESRIAHGDLAEEIAGLKREPGKDMIASGGAAFAQSLTRLNSPRRCGSNSRSPE